MMLKEQMFKDLRLTHVLSILSEKIPESPFVSCGNHLFLQAEDSLDFDLLGSGVLDKAVKFLKESIQQVADARIFVHCAQGVSRSGSAVCAYLMKENGQNLESTLGFVKACRACVQPNSGFMKQLRSFESSLNL